MNVSVIGKIYAIIDKSTQTIVKVGSTIRTLEQRFSQTDYKTKYTNHLIREIKQIESSELDWYDPYNPHCPFLWHLVASEHLEMLKARTFRMGDLSNQFSPLDQKFFSRFGASNLSVLGGQRAGRQHVLSGHLKSISSKGGLVAGPTNGHKNGLALRVAGKGIFKPGVAAMGGRKGGPTSGRLAVESGQLGSLRTFEHQSKASKFANHSRWHSKRNIVNLQCELCQEALE